MLSDDVEVEGEDAVAEGSVKKTPAKKVAAKKAPVKKSTPKQGAEQILESIPEDTDDPVAKIYQENVMVYMKSGYSYSGPDVKFTREKPFHLMNPLEAERLIKDMPYRFDYATKEQVAEFYSLG